MSGLSSQQYNNENDARQLPSGSDAQSSSSSSRFDWTMKLFGGGGRKATQSAPKSARLGRPGHTSANRRNEERQGLMQSSSADDFDDSDAISLLSNIANRDSRPGSSAAAARRRARALQRSEGRTCGMLMFNIQTMGQSLSCGLLGRPRKAEPSRRTRADSFGSVIRGGSSARSSRRTDASISNAPQHSRHPSDISVDSSASILGTGPVDSGDEDAGMLDDQVIARFGHQPQTSDSTLAPNNNAPEFIDIEEHAVKTDEDSKIKQQGRLQEEALRLIKEAEAEALAHRQEEDRLAAEEEAAVLKARRKAERKAAKQGFTQRNSTPNKAPAWRTEADAEAAAGGFEFAEDSQQQEDEDESALSHQHYDDGLDNYDHAYDPEDKAYSQYDDAEEHDGYAYEDQGQSNIVHHHHYYHPTSMLPAEVYGGSSHGFAPTLTSISNKHVSDETNSVEAGPEAAPSEDEADIAGLSFGRKKNRSGSTRNISGSRGSASASGTGLSAGSLQPSSSNSSSAAGKQTYRNSPRRHERTVSASSHSSSGLHSYQSEVHPATTNATSIAPSQFPAEVPDLHAKAGHPISNHGADDETSSPYRHAAADGAGRGSRFGKSAVDANEFGIITAGTDKGGAGRAKKSYREKRKPGAVSQSDETPTAFEGFPGF